MTEVLTYKSRNRKKGGRHSCVLQRARRYQVASVSEIKILGSVIQTNGGTKQPCEQPAWYRYNVTQVLQWNYNIIPRSSSSRSRANIGYVDATRVLRGVARLHRVCIARKEWSGVRVREWKIYIGIGRRIKRYRSKKTEDCPQCSTVQPAILPVT